jgi:hypothetical protein
MALYELSIEPAHVAEAERLIALEGREYPTLVMHWESKLFDQPWLMTVVLDYIIALPPLGQGSGNQGSTFIPVRVGAFVGGAPTKYFYFGTEMNETVPRLGPEMENIATPASLYQEFLLDDRTSPIPYLKLIQATPRIYGNGPQDYYAPPIPVERFDAMPRPHHIADTFPNLVAGLEPLTGDKLIDPAIGSWIGSRYVGIRQMAVLRQAKIVGMVRRAGKTDRDVAPPEVARRDPNLDIRDVTVAIDFGTRSTVVAVRGERSPLTLVRLGTLDPAVRTADFENPSEVAFESLRSTTKAWRERVIQPQIRWDEVKSGVAAAEVRRADPKGDAGDPVKRAAAALPRLGMLREYVERKVPFVLRGFADPETNEPLKKPAPPIIDEEGIGAFDPFDPIEVYAYHLGLTINHRLRGIHLRYEISMPTGWPADRRLSVLMAFRRGLFRSLPAGLVEYHEVDKLSVVDAGPSALHFAATAFRVFSVAPNQGPVTFAVLEAGASESGLLFGLLRDPTPEERREGKDRVIEYLEPQSLPWFGGERLLHRMAYQVYCDHIAEMSELRIPMEKPEEEPGIGGGEDLLHASPEARGNRTLLVEAIRPLFEGDPTYRLPSSIRLADEVGTVREIKLALNRVTLRQSMDAWFGQAAAEFKERVVAALQRLARVADPFDGLRILLGGRMSMHTTLQDMVQKSFPPNVRVHKYREPDKTNLQAPSVKTSCAVGILSMRYDRIGAQTRVEQRDAFRYRVGRPRHGQLQDVLDPAAEYDVWRDCGACTRPVVEVLFMRADDDGEVAADDPRVMRAGCDLGVDAIGLRLFMRAVGEHRVEVAAGSPDSDPSQAELRCAVDLTTGMATPL